MTFNSNLLSQAVRYALITGAVSLASPVFAQDSAKDEDSTRLESIVVTGSRIRKVDLETAQPILVIDREEIEKQGFQSVADILQNVSAAGAPTISRASPLSAGENVGGSYISLRNLGANRTLVLINGKRLGITTSGLQDISTIPASMVQSIEVLKDGASSIYGSDAIGGVINIITRTNYEGMEANAYWGQYGEGDGTIKKYDFVMGTSGERGSITFAAEMADEEGVNASDRPYSAYPRSDKHPFVGWTTVSQWGGITTGGTRVLNRGADPYNIANYHAVNGTAPDGDVSNPNEQTDLHTPLERKSLFVDGIYNINDDVRFRADLAYSNREASRQVAGYPYQSASFSTPMSINSYYNPLGNAHGATSPQAINWFRRTWEIPRVSVSDLDTFRFTGGFDGSFDLAGRSFDWDAGYLYSSNKLVQSSYGNLNIPRVAAAVGPSFLNAQGQVQCGTSAAPIATTACVPWNPFLPFGREGDGGLTNNQALIDYLFQEEHATGDTSTKLITANITGPIFTLPAGDLSFALGGEHRKEAGAFTPDALAVAGQSTNLSAGPTEGDYSVDEVYAEFFVPVLKDMAFAKELSLSVASRYSDYNTFGDTTNNKVGFTWKPIDELLFRGTRADGFRAPTISDLYGGGSQTFESYTDPCDTVYGASATNSTVRARCAQDVVDANTFRQLQQGFVPGTTSNPQTPLPFVRGSNPNLLPEESKSSTLGVVWSPRFSEGLNMSLDWWKIRIDNTITSDTPTQMLSDCYVDNIASRCLSFTRDRSIGGGIVNTLTFGSRNAGYEETTGYDFDLTYKLPTDYGNFSLLWQNTYVDKYEFKSTNDEIVIPSQQNGFAFRNGTAFRLRSNLNLGWAQGDWGVNWGVRYYSGIKETCLSRLTFPDECSIPDYVAASPADTRPLNQIGANTFHDLQVRWSAPWKATVSVGANNITDHVASPMYVQPSSNTSYYGGFDIGRFYYLKYQQRF